MFESVCIGLTDADLNRRVYYENGSEATIRWGIWHIADHSRYHQANIKHLKFKVIVQKIRNELNLRLPVQLDVRCILRVALH
jgi:hypothetical protein